MAGEPRIELELTVLETGVLPLDHTPITINDCLLSEFFLFLGIIGVLYLTKRRK